jgi:fucose permease
MLLGRLACGYVVKRWVSTYRMLIIITITSAVLISLAPLFHTAAVNAALFLCASLFFAGITPLLLSASAIYPKSESSSAYSILFIMMSSGGLIVPWVMGQAFELVGVVTGMSLIGALFLGALAFMLLFRKELPIAKHAHYEAFPG